MEPLPIGLGITGERGVAAAAAEADAGTGAGRPLPWPLRLRPLPGRSLQATPPTEHTHLPMVPHPAMAEHMGHRPMGHRLQVLAMALDIHLTGHHHPSGHLPTGHQAIHQPQATVLHLATARRPQATAHRHLTDRLRGTVLHLQVMGL